MCGTVCLDGMTCEDGQPIECVGGEEPYCPTTPIVIDVDVSGFFLTSLAGGVNFDITDWLYLNRVSWTQQTSTNAWLALARGGDAKIDMASDLFGNLTPNLSRRRRAPERLPSACCVRPAGPRRQRRRSD